MVPSIFSFVSVACDKFCWYWWCLDLSLSFNRATSCTASASLFKSSLYDLFFEPFAKPEFFGLGFLGFDAVDATETRRCAARLCDGTGFGGLFFFLAVVFFVGPDEVGLGATTRELPASEVLRVRARLALVAPALRMLCCSAFVCSSRLQGKFLGGKIGQKLFSTHKFATRSPSFVRHCSFSWDQTPMRCFLSGPHDLRSLSLSPLPRVHQPITNLSLQP